MTALQTSLAYSFASLLALSRLPFVSFRIVTVLFAHSFITLFFSHLKRFTTKMCKRWMMVFRIVRLSVSSRSVNLRCACRIVIHSVRCHVNATDYWCNEIAKTTLTHKHTHAHSSQIEHERWFEWFWYALPKDTRKTEWSSFIARALFSF